MVTWLELTWQMNRFACIGHLIEWIRFIYILTRIVLQILCLDAKWIDSSFEKSIDYHTEKFGYKESNTDFVQGYIEKLRETRLKENYYEIIRQVFYWPKFLQ